MGLLIAIEGIDGSGKGTQSARLTDTLLAQGVRAAMLQFPRYAATSFGKAIGDFLNGRFGSLDQVHPQLAALLYAGDRFESKSLLQSMLDENDVVVLDRYIGSNLAHQAAKRDGDERRRLMEWIEHVEFSIYGLPHADLTLLIDMSSAWSRELVGRKAARDYTDRTADLQEADLPYMEKVRQCYRQIAESRADWTVIPGLTETGELRTVAEVGGHILRIVTARLAEHALRPA